MNLPDRHERAKDHYHLLPETDPHDRNHLPAAGRAKQRKQRHKEAGPSPTERTVLLPDPGQHQTEERTGQNTEGKVP